MILRRPDRGFAALVTLAYLPVALFAITHHEMWRDELHGLAVLFALLLCANHARRFDRPIATALLLAALALTSTVSSVVAAAYAATLIVECLAGLRRGDGLAPRAWIPIAVSAASGIAAAWCAWPPADSTVTRIAWPKELPPDDAPTRLIVAFCPIPRIDFLFWNSNALLSWGPFRRVALWVSLALAAWALFVLSRHMAAAVLFAVGTLLLVALFAGVYGGDVRHHGFLFVLFLMGAWIATSSGEGAGGGGWRRFRARALAPSLAVVLVAHVAGAPIALYYDYKYVFSSGARAAKVLLEKGLGDSLLVAEMDFPATAVIGALGSGAFAYSPRNGRRFSFVKWTKDRHWDPSDAQTLDYATAMASLRREDAILLMNRPLVPDLVDGKTVTRIAELYDSMIEEENFYIYRVAK